MGPATASSHMLGSMLKRLSILAVLHFSLSAAESLQDGAEFDYIVVGGGAAGEIVASRLSENPNIMVALLEAGEEPDLNMEPNNFPKVSQGGDRYGFSTYQDGFSAQYIQDENVRVIAEEFTGGATPWVHMMHLRGHPNDYQGWADAAGDNSWNYENMLRYFIRSEQVKDQRTLDSSVTGYGTEGTLNLTRESSDANSKIIQAFEELGYEYHLNLNATLGITEPFYYISEGQFQSIYKSYIVPARNRSNLFIYPKTTATLIRFDDDQTATGVQAYNAEDTYVEVRARQEIILASGVIRTPQLMLLSGIGAAADLDDWSISVVSDLPVGEGMSDRVGAIVAFKLKESNDSTQTSNDYMAPTTVAFKALDSSEDTSDYQATNHIFPRNSEGLPKLCVDSYQYKAEICEKLKEINSEHELMFSVVSITRPQSTGFLALNSLDMFDDPFIYMGYFAETADLENLAASLGDFSNIVNTENFSGLGAELVDFELTECGSLQQNSQDYWMCYGQFMSTTTWNVVGTAQMGDVLDSKLNVRGVQKLRVVDSSAIPFAHSGYLLPSIIVMAEKAADLILDNVEISNLVTDVSEENILASEEKTEPSSEDEQGSSASDENASAQGSNDSDEEISLDSQGNVSAQETNNSNENEGSRQSVNEAAPSSEDEAAPLSKDEDSASTSKESSSASEENASAQKINDLDEDSARSETQGSPSPDNEAAPSFEDKQGSSASDENASAQGSNDLDEESSLDSQGNVSAQETNNSNENEGSRQSENEAAPSSEDEAVPLSEDEDGASTSEESSSESEENASAQKTNDLDEDAARSESQGIASSENEAVPSSEDEQGSSASDENASTPGSNDLDEESSLDSQGNVSVQETNNSNENEDSPQSENEAASSSEDEAAPLSKDEDSASTSKESSSASEENASAQKINDLDEDSARSETQGSPSPDNEAAPSFEDKQGSSTSDENASAQGSNDLDEESSLDSQGNVSAQETNNSNENEGSRQSENEAAPSSEDEAVPLSEDEDGASTSEESSSASEENASAQKTNDLDEDAARFESQGIASSENEAVPSSEDEQGSSASDENASTQGSNDLDEESSLDFQGNVSVQKTNNSNENEDSPQSENEAASSSEDEAAPLSEDEDGAAEISGRSGSVGEGSGNDVSDQAAENETNSTSETQGNSTLDALKDGAVAWLLGSMGSSGSDEEESVLGSEIETEAVSGRSGSEGEGSGNDVSDQAAENETNSTFETKANDAVKDGAVDWLLGSMGRSGSDEEPITNLEDNEEAKYGLSAVLAAHLLGDSESTTEAIRGLFGRYESESVASNGWFGSVSESDETTGLFGSGTANNDDEKEKSNLGRHYLRMRMLSGR